MRFSNIEYLCEDAAIVDFVKSRFDSIFASFLFMYLTDEEMKSIASKIKKWLAPGGHVFLRGVLRIGANGSDGIETYDL